MGLRVLIVPDKFKGTLSAREVAASIASGWQAVRPEDSIELAPMSDGGDGFGEVIGSRIEAEVQTTKTVDAAHRSITAQWWWDPRTRTAIIEGARVNGLALLPPGKYHPFELDTVGLGELLKAATTAGARRCIVGVGGSATNDGGFGVARAMGWEFFNTKSALIDRWTDLHTLSQIKPPRREKWFDELLVAVDVNNPLLGERGCTRVYGPQKGLKPTDFEFAERCLLSLATLAKQELHIDAASEPGCGAAGGLAFGLRTFLGGRLVRGFEVFSDMARLVERIREADLVITGEGAIDEQTLMGKGVGELAGECRRLGKPVIGIAGMASVHGEGAALFDKILALTSFTTHEEARAKPAHWTEQAARRAAETWAGARLAEPVNR